MKVLIVLWSFLLLLACFPSASYSQNSQVITFNAANTSILTDENTGLKIVKFVKVLDKYFNIDKPLQIIKVKTYKKCLQSCVATGKCVATNFGKSANSERLFDCWLIDTDIFKNMTRMMDNLSFDFYHINTIKVIES